MFCWFNPQDARPSLDRLNVFVCRLFVDSFVWIETLKQCFLKNIECLSLNLSLNFNQWKKNMIQRKWSKSQNMKEVKQRKMK